MTTHPFLSDEWFEAVQRIKGDATGNPVETAGLVVNATITNVPFGSGIVELHSSHGPMVGWTPGHADDPVIAMTVDYHTARALILDDSLDMRVLDQAGASGALSIDGDAGALRAWFATRRANPEAATIEDSVRAITR
jgi:hypothetical protein